jgi:hypothetical protein
MGWSQLPEKIIQPHDDKGENYFVNARKNDLTLKGVLGIIFLGVALVVFYYTLGTEYWYFGIALMILVIVSFWWSTLLNRRPADLKGRPSK